MKALGAAALLGLASQSTSGAARRTDDQLSVDRHGPQRTGRFEVQIDDVEVPGWRSVTIPSSSTEQSEYREDNEPEWEKKVWGHTTFDDLEMERGVQPGDTRIVEWREQVHKAGHIFADLLEEGEIDAREVEARTEEYWDIVDEVRKNVEIVLRDDTGQPVIAWEFMNAWVKEYDPPELDASADGDVATESITVAFDKMKRKEA